MEKKRDICITLLSGALIFAVSLVGLITPDKEFSDRERRYLNVMPKVSAETLSDGSFMEGFDDYAYDQFPARDAVLRLKSFVVRRLLHERDDGGFYIREGQICQLLYPLATSKVDKNSERIKAIYDQYLRDSDCKTYLSIIPDKNLYMAEPNGYPALDYEEFFGRVSKDLSFARFIDLSDELDASSYYSTDHHWRQEKLIPVANKILLALENEGIKKGDYTPNILDVPFYGTYYNQSGIEVPGDGITYFTSPSIDGALVYNYSGAEAESGVIYDMEKAHGRDAYEMFLSGTQPVQVIENPNATSDRELVLFRDSYSASLAPLLIEAYSRITLIDLRYISAPALGEFIQFEDQDVLFIYSTITYNNTISMGL